MRKENFEQVEKLSFDEMAEISGGCGKIGSVMGIAGGVLSIASFAFPPAGIMFGLCTAFGLSLGVAGIGCGIADLVG